MCDGALHLYTIVPFKDPWKFESQKQGACYFIEKCRSMSILQSVLSSMIELSPLSHNEFGSRYILRIPFEKVYHSEDLEILGTLSEQ